MYDFDDEAIYKRLYAFVPPIKGSDNQIIGYVVAYELSDGYTESHFMSVKELNDHYAIYASGSEIWKKHPGVMRKKAVLRHVLRAGAPLGGCENQNYVSQGLSADGRAVSFDDEIDFAIIEGQYQDNTQYESQASHTQMQGIATNIPKMFSNAKQFEKLLATLHKTPMNKKHSIIKTSCISMCLVTSSLMPCLLWWKIIITNDWCAKPVRLSYKQDISYIWN